MNYVWHFSQVNCLQFYVKILSLRPARPSSRFSLGLNYFAPLMSIATVGVLCIGVDKSKLYLALELYRGVSLQRMLRGVFSPYYEGH